MIESLCTAACAGDTQALERLLWSYHERLLSFARRKIGPEWQSKIEPEDLLQEAYIQAFDSISRFTYQGAESFYHWMTRIIDHRFIDAVRHWRAQKRAAATRATPLTPSLLGHLSLLDQCGPKPETPSAALRREDAVRALMSCIAQLPEDYRVVVQRFYLKQEPLAQIAADLGRSEDAVRRLAGRAVECLQACLGRASRFLSTSG